MSGEYVLKENGTLARVDRGIEGYPFAMVAVGGIRRARQ
jgi:hypothetical protein